MSKMGQLVVEMQEEALDMNLTEFTAKYGIGAQSVWNQMQEEFDLLEMDDGA
jgi:hypothetical protein|tara:strand:- start:80 stop:235 length:156 start_codon:yes stop_codon:yes gene_type:complete